MKLRLHGLNQEFWGDLGHQAKAGREGDILSLLSPLLFFGNSYRDAICVRENLDMIPFICDLAPHHNLEQIVW